MGDRLKDIALVVGVLLALYGVYRAHPNLAIVLAGCTMVAVAVFASLERSGDE